MSNFVLLPPRDYVAELLRVAPHFAASAEYQSLECQDRACAGLVFAALARFFEASFAGRLAVEECSNAIEHFASMNDAEAHNLLVTEVFDGFQNAEISVGLLLPFSRALYDCWIGREL